MSRGCSRPRRTCIGCRRVADPSELVRVALAPDGSIVAGRYVPGRGAWLCAGSPECFDAAAKRRAFPLALRTEVSGAEVALLRERLVSR